MRQQEPPDELPVSSAKREVLLDAHEELREEIRSHGARKSRRFIATFTVTGAVIGYVFARQGDTRLLALVPLLLAFQYFTHISSANYVARLAAILCRIEKMLNCAGFEYEYYYGRFRILSNPVFRTGLDERPAPNNITEYGIQAIAGLAYVLAAVVGIVTFWRHGLAGLGLSPSLVTAVWVRGGIGLMLAAIYGGLLWLVLRAYREYRIRCILERAAIAVTDPEDFDGVATAQWKAQQRARFETVGSDE